MHHAPGSRHSARDAFKRRTTTPNSRSGRGHREEAHHLAKGIGDLSIPERRLTYREALESKYKEYQHQKRASMLGPLRRAYG